MESYEWLGLPPGADFHVEAHGRHDQDSSRHVRLTPWVTASGSEGSRRFVRPAFVAKSTHWMQVRREFFLDSREKCDPGFGRGTNERALLRWGAQRCANSHTERAVRGHFGDKTMPDGSPDAGNVGKSALFYRRVRLASDVLMQAHACGMISPAPRQENIETRSCPPLPFHFWEESGREWHLMSLKES